MFHWVLGLVGMEPRSLRSISCRGVPNGARLPAPAAGPRDKGIRNIGLCWDRGKENGSYHSLLGLG